MILKLKAKFIVLGFFATLLFALQFGFEAKPFQPNADGDSDTQTERILETETEANTEKESNENSASQIDLLSEIEGPLPEAFFERVPDCLTLSELRSLIPQGCALLRTILEEVRCGVLVEDSNGAVIFAQNAEDAFVPASNTKLITSAAALYYLGGAYRFTTEFYLRRERLKNGVLHDALFVRGGGDPMLVYEKLWRIARMLRAYGLKEVRKGIVVDNSMFANITAIPGSDFESNDRAYRAIPSAFASGFGAFEIIVRPAEKRGKPAVVAVEPPLKDFITVENRVRTVSRIASTRIRAETFPLKNGGVRLVLRGRIALQREPVVLYRRVPVPWKYAAKTLKFAMQQAGIKVRGKVKQGSVPPEASLFYEHYSPPLWQILGYVNKSSSNFIAEQVLLTTTAVVLGEPADFDKAQQLLKSFLLEIGVNDKNAVLENGSGLTLNNRLSPKTVVRLLERVAANPFMAPEFLTSLSLSGRDGTLRSRLPLIGENALVRAKTGTLEDSLALSGYVITEEHKRLLFSAFVNGCDKRERELCTAYLDWLATALTKFSTEEVERSQPEKSAVAE